MPIIFLFCVFHYHINIISISYQFVYSTIIEGILNTKNVSSPLWGDVDDAFDTYTKSWNQQLFSVSADKDTSK